MSYANDGEAREYDGRHGDRVVIRRDGSDVHAAVVEYLMENYYHKHQAYCDESIMQLTQLIDAPAVLAAIAYDILKFEVVSKRDDD